MSIVLSGKVILLARIVVLVVLLRLRRLLLVLFSLRLLFIQLAPDFVDDALRNMILDRIHIKNTSDLQSFACVLRKPDVGFAKDLADRSTVQLQDLHRVNQIGHEAETLHTSSQQKPTAAFVLDRFVRHMDRVLKQLHL